MHHIVYSTDFEKPYRARSVSAGLSNSIQAASEPSHAHRSYSTPSSMIESSNSISNPPSFPSSNLSFNNLQTTQGYTNSNYPVSSSPSFLSATMQFPQNQTGQYTSTTDLAPTSAVPVYTSHYYPHPTSTSTFSPQMVSTAGNASYAQPVASKDMYLTTPVSESSQQSISPVRSTYFESNIPVSEDRVDSEEESHSHSGSGYSALDIPTGAHSLPFQSSNPQTPLSPDISGDYESFVTPQVLHRRSIERKARMKRRAAEREVHSLLMSEGIASRGKANMLNTLLNLYKARVEEVNKLKEALESLKARPTTT